MFIIAGLLALAAWGGHVIKQQVGLLRIQRAARRETRQHVRFYVHQVQGLMLVLNGDVPGDEQAALSSLTRRLEPGEMRRRLDRVMASPHYQRLSATERAAMADQAMTHAPYNELRAQLELILASRERSFDIRLAHLRQASHLASDDPTRRRARLALGRLHFEKGRIGVARDLFQDLTSQSVQTTEGVMARAWLGRALLRLGLFDSAQQLLLLALADDDVLGIELLRDVRSELALAGILGGGWCVPSKSAVPDRRSAGDRRSR